MATQSGKRLTKIIKRYLDVVWYLGLVAVVVIPAVFAFTAAEVDDAEDPPPDVPVLLRFHMAEHATGVAPSEPAPDYPTLAGGQGELRIRTRSRLVWYLTLATIEIILVVVLYGVRQMRAVFASLVGGEPFCPQNPSRIRKIGLVVVGWHVVAPFLQYFFARAVLPDVHVPGLVLRPPLDFNPEGMVLGLAVIVLAEVFRAATILQHEQSLTV